MPEVRAGLLGQVVLLAILDRTAGLGAAGWLAGLAYGMALAFLLGRGFAGTGLGPADRVTLLRATLVGGVTALTADSFRQPAPVALLVALTAVALALDAVDGRVARGTGTASAPGARFDMEVDAYLLVVLGVHLAPALGGWVIAIGAMRYAYAAAGWFLPWLPGPLPARQWRKVVAATQGVALLVAAAGVLPRPVTAAVAAVALALLVESFARDTAYRWGHRAPVLV